MKKVFMILAVLLLMVGQVYGATPYLVCDPQAGVTDYQLLIDSSSGPVTSAAQSDGSLYYSLDSIATGTHTIKVTPCNLWGCAATPTSITFVKSVPGTSTNVKIVVIK